MVFMAGISRKLLKFY